MRKICGFGWLLLAGCGGGKGANLAQALQALVDSTVAATPSIPGLILAVKAPALGLDWQGSAGVWNVNSYMSNHKTISSKYDEITV